MKEKSEESKKPNSMEDNRLEAVRDLLFGQNDQEYRKEFQEIRSEIDSNKKQLEDKSEAINSDLIDRLEKLEKKMEDHIIATDAKLTQQIDALSHEKVDRKKMADLLQQIAKELNS